MNITGTLIALLCGGILVLAFGGGGAYLIYRTRKNQQQADASQNWPGTNGQIIEAEVRHSTSTDSEGDRTDSYTPHVRYTYRANEADYAGDKITFGFVTGYGSESKANAILAKYPVGAPVTVYYDPAAPDKAVLERKAGGATAGMIIGIVLCVIAVCIACSAGIAVLTWAVGSR